MLRRSGSGAVAARMLTALRSLAARVLKPVLLKPLGFISWR